MKQPSNGLGADYWSNRYKNDEAGWNIGTVSQPLKEYFDQLKDKAISILIPGCGNAYEAEYLLQQGFTDITLIDISPVLAENIRNKFSDNSDKIKVICGDFFELDKTFDLIVEQTFFCAIDPSLRKKYADKMYELLNKGGKLAGVMFNTEFESGPPFSGSKEEYKKLFSEKFTIKTMEECYNSIPKRKGNEVFVILEK